MWECSLQEGHHSSTRNNTNQLDANLIYLLHKYI